MVSEAAWNPSFIEINDKSFPDLHRLRISCLIKKNSETRKFWNYSLALLQTCYVILSNMSYFLMVQFSQKREKKKKKKDMIIVL